MKPLSTLHCDVICLSLYLAICCVSLVEGVCACYVTLSGNLMYESCRKGVCPVTCFTSLVGGVCLLCHPIHRLAVQVNVTLFGNLMNLVGGVCVCYVTLSSDLMSLVGGGCVCVISPYPAT